MSFVPGRNAEMTLRVMTYNVWDCPFVAPYRTARMGAIATVLRSGDYDIVGMQEVWMDATMALFKSAAAEGGLKYSHNFTAGCDLPGGGRGGGLVVFSRFPILDAHFQGYSTNGQPYQIEHWDFQAGKGIGYCCVRTPHSLVDVYITHLISQYDDNDLYHTHRTAQAIECATFMRLTGRSPLTLLLTDLNAGDTTLSYRILSQFGRLVDSFKSLHPEDKGLTYGIVGQPFADFDRPDVPGYLCSINRRLDYVFYRARADVGCQQWKLESCVVAHKDLVVPKGASGQRLPRSDHYAVVARFKSFTAPLADGLLSPSGRGLQAIVNAGLPGTAPGGDPAADAELMREAQADLKLGLKLSLWKKNMQSTMAIALLLMAAAVSWFADHYLGREATAAGAQAANYVWCFLPIGFAVLFRIVNEKLNLLVVGVLVFTMLVCIGSTLPWNGIAGFLAFVAFGCVPLGVLFASLAIVTAASEALGMQNVNHTAATQLRGLLAAASSADGRL